MKTPPPNYEAPSRFRLALASGLSCCAVMMLFGFGYWAWAFRDGMKAGFVESSGTEAWRRFFRDFWPYGLLCLGLFLVAYFLARPRVVSPSDRK